MEILITLSTLWVFSFKKQLFIMSWQLKARNVVMILGIESLISSVQSDLQANLMSAPLYGQSVLCTALWSVSVMYSSMVS